jgi:hypothetical protein
VQDYEELDEYLNNLSDDDVEPHLTKQDYEKSLDLGSLFDDDQDVNNLGDSTYKGLDDSIMVELQNKYDLRPREKSIFNLENKLNKIKIPVPLVELARNPVYKKQISKVINFSDVECQADVINLQDEKPTIMFGPHIENNKDSVAPFYITLTVHDHLLHNCMLDSIASHNLMPNIIMEKLGLQITRPYQDLYSFDSRKVKCLGMIKDLVVNLAQVPVKSILMDVVVVDIPAKYGMLLSRSWGAKLGGSVQLDMTYATIPIFGG